jgi:hypothetical protein
MKYLLIGVAALLLIPAAALRAHGPGDSITWNREVARIVYAKCISCHRPEGTAFSLVTYPEVQPRANEIKEAVLTRRMPPWGAVKGFGNFRNDQSLMQEQIEIITKWVDGGIRRGNNPRQLPDLPPPQPASTFVRPSGAVVVHGQTTLRDEIVLDGLIPDRLTGDSMRITARRPGGAVVPLVWLHGYDTRYAHPFLFRQPVRLPAGTVIDGVPADAQVALLPATP